ncbi:MAG: MFS transporter [Elusimicrobia bacterium]|nr:MFS transporter [Elusimicrobiota bacterium]
MTANTQTLPPRQDNIGMLEKIGYASGDMACNFIYQTIIMYLTFFYTDIFGISAKAVGIMFFVSRFWDAITDPVIGAFIDKHHFKDGKYRPYMRYGAIPFLVTAVLCFTTPGFNDVGKIIYAYVTYILLTMVYTTINIPYGALTAAMTRRQDETASITSVRMFMANAGGVIIAFFLPFLAGLFGAKFGPQHGYQMTMVVMGIIGASLLLFCYKSTKERVVPVSEEPIKVKDMISQFKLNTPLILLCVMFAVNFSTFSIAGGVGTYYIQYNLGRPDLLKYFNLAGTIPAIILFPFVPAMVRAVGKKPFMYGGILLNMVFTLAYLIIPPGAVWAAFVCKIVAAVGGITGGYAWALVPEAITYGEYKTGHRMGGVAYAAIGFFFKFGLAVGGMLLGFMLDLFKYVPNQVQSAESLRGILIMVSIVPAILMFITLVIMKFYPLDDKRYAELVHAVEERAAAQA